MQGLREELATKVPGLLTFGFEIVSYSFDPRIFGDSLVVLRSPAFWLRLIRERGNIFAEVAPLSNPETWWDVGLLLNPEARPLDLEGVTSELLQNYDELTEALGPKLNETREKVAERLTERRSRFPATLSKPKFARRFGFLRSRRFLFYFALTVLLSIFSALAGCGKTSRAA